MRSLDDDDDEPSQGPYKSRNRHLSLDSDRESALVIVTRALDSNQYGFLI
jgi:hypothetical protein